MQERVASYIRGHGLLREGARVLVGLSGGADSVTLLHILQRLGYTCIAAHCNFHLRGEESMRDERFVRELCEKADIPLLTTDFATGDYARTHGISIEMAAREQRYGWFEEMRRAHDCEAIAVAHHQNDQAETLLLNLSRGTGIRGLCGMRPKNGYIIRPLLCLTRREIEQYAQMHGLTFVTDSTNGDTHIRRNAFRAVLQQASEQEIRHMAETASLMQAYSTLVDALVTGQAIPEEAEQPLLYEMLRPYGFNASQTGDMLAALPASGKRFDAEDFTATIDHGTLSVRSKAAEAEETPLILRAVRPRKAQEHFPDASEQWALMDADTLREPLRLRHWQQGDAFYPITAGTPGKKKLQDFFSDQRLSIAEKERVWLLCSGEGDDEKIAWVIGYRLDNRFKITDKTSRVAEIEISEEMGKCTI